MSRIATIGPDIARDIVAATGCTVERIGWDLTRATPHADRWIESKFMPWASSILESWAEGAFDAIDRVIFSRADDTAHRLYYYVCELQRRGQIGGPQPLIADMARAGGAGSLAFTIRATRHLCARLDLSDAALERGIALANAERRAKAMPSRASAPICLIAGTPPPDRRLHAMIEAQGWAALGDTLADLWADAGDAVAEGTADPAAAIGRQLHQKRFPTGQPANPATALAEAARTSDAQAVLLWLIEEEDARVWHLPAQKAALDAMGVPCLAVSRRSWRADDGVDEAITAFLTGVTG